MTPDEVVALLRLIVRQSVTIDHLSAQVELLQEQLAQAEQRIDDALADSPSDEPT